MIFFKRFYLNTTAQIDFIKVTSEVKFAIRDSRAANGLATVLVPKGGAALTVIEESSGIIDELKLATGLFIGEGREGENMRKEKVKLSARVQSAVFGRSVAIPFADGKPLFDPYDEIYLIDFEERSLRREVVVQVMGENPAADVQQQQRPAPRQRR